MPEHVHVLMSDPKRGTPSTVLQMPPVSLLLNSICLDKLSKFYKWRWSSPY
jgi:hypothetical protein